MNLFKAVADISRKLSAVDYNDKKGYYNSYNDKSKLQLRNYEMALEKLWKAQELAPYLGFSDGNSGYTSIVETTSDKLDKQLKVKIKEFHDSIKTEKERKSLHEILSLIVHGEAYALYTSSTLHASVKTTEAKLALAAQTIEEAKHYIVLRKITTDLYGYIRPLKPSARIAFDTIANARGNLKLFGMNVVLENTALLIFEKFNEYPMLSDVTYNFHLDESRHTGLPINYGNEGNFTKLEKGILGKAGRTFMLIPAPLLVAEYWMDFANIGMNPIKTFDKLIRKISELAERSDMPLMLTDKQVKDMLKVNARILKLLNIT